LAVGISGSGPTLFAIADDGAVARALATWLNQHYRQNELGFAHVCRADLGGARSVD
jgi:homoserine kinase